MQIHVKIDAAAAGAALDGMLARLRDTRPLRAAIGEALLRSTKERIGAGGPDPEGEPWEPLSPAYLLVKKGRGILAETGMLHSTLVWQLTPDGVAVGSNRAYAAIHQLGGEIRKPASVGTVRLRKSGGRTLFAKKTHKRATALTVRIGAHTIRIPARPYLGVSAADGALLEESVADWARGLLEGR
jgi:phage virion morphogenesis protein